MSAQFMAAFVRRFGCTVNIVSGREYDSNGGSADRGGSCVECGQCERGLGVVGVAAEGVKLVSEQSGLYLVWACPTCGCETTEETELLLSAAGAKEVLRDGDCYRCRAIKKETA